MLRLKPVMAIVIALILVLGMCTVSSAAATPGTKILLDGKEIATSVAPRSEGGYQLVPVKAVAEALGGVVEYNSTIKEITITTADHKVKIMENKKVAYVDGKSVTLSVPMRYYANTNFVHSKFLADALGATVSYNGTAKTLNFKYFSQMSGSLKISGSTTIQPITDAAAKALMEMNKGSLTVTVTGGGSGVGVKDAAAGAVNIGNSSAALTDAQKQTYPDLIQTQIGSDAVAVILNKKNPVKNLTKQQVFEIFTGKIVNWKQVGGNDAPILVQVRESTSGTAASFFDLAIKPVDSKAKIPASFTPSISSGALMQAVATNENAIGYDSYGYINDTVKAVAVDEIECTDNNVNALIWPYTRSLVMLTKGAPSGLAAKLINYVRSTEGQQILVKMDYIQLRNQYAKKVK